MDMLAKVIPTCCPQSSKCSCYLIHSSEIYLISTNKCIISSIGRKQLPQSDSPHSYNMCRYDNAPTASANDNDSISKAPVMQMRKSKVVTSAFLDKAPGSSLGRNSMAILRKGEFDSEVFLLAIFVQKIPA